MEKYNKINKLLLFFISEYNYELKAINQYIQ